MNVALADHLPSAWDPTCGMIFLSKTWLQGNPNPMKRWCFSFHLGVSKLELQQQHQSEPLPLMEMMHLQSNSHYWNNHPDKNADKRLSDKITTIEYHALTLLTWKVLEMQLSGIMRFIEKHSEPKWSLPLNNLYNLGGSKIKTISKVSHDWIKPGQTVLQGKGAHLLQFCPHVFCSVSFTLTWNMEAGTSGNCNILCLFSCNCKGYWTTTFCCCPVFHLVFKITENYKINLEVCVQSMERWYKRSK